MRTVPLLLTVPLASLLLAQDPPTPDTFAAPVRLKAGDKFLGEGRLYPSPMFHDMNGDGISDIVVGDLVGKITIALRKPGEPVSYAAETKMLAADGKPLDFANW